MGVLFVNKFIFMIQNNFLNNDKEFLNMKESVAISCNQYLKSNGQILLPGFILLKIIGEKILPYFFSHMHKVLFHAFNR